MITDDSATFDAAADRYVWHFGDAQQLPTLNPSPANVEDADLPLHRASQHFVATASSAMQINLSWSDVGSDYTYYEVYRHTSNDNSGLSPIASPLTVNGRTYMDMGTSLEAGTTYYYWLKACPADTMVMCSDFFAHTRATTPVIFLSAVDLSAACTEFCRLFFHSILNLNHPQLAQLFRDHFSTTPVICVHLRNLRIKKSIACTEFYRLFFYSTLNLGHP